MTDRYQPPRRLAPNRSAIERGCGDPLVDLLDPDPILRRYAVDAVELDSVGLYALRERLLHDSHAPVRLAAGERFARASAQLWRGGSAEIVAPTQAELVGWLGQAVRDPLPSVREVACRGLARHAETEHGLDSTLAELVVRDPIWWVRRAAARALAAVAGEAAIAPLIPGLDDPFWRVRHGVVQALDLIVKRSGGGDVTRESLRLRVLEAGAGASEVARAALAYLASGWPEGDGDVPEVLGLIRDPGAGLELSDADPAVVTARLRAAGSVDPASLVPLLAESHEALREEATRRLAKLDDPACVEPALAWLEDPRVPNAPAAVLTLLDKLGARARGLAARALELGRPAGIVWAAGWIAGHAAEDLHPALLRHRQHPRVDVRVAVVRALGSLLVRERGRDAGVRESLIAGLGDPALAVRDAAALGLLDARVYAPLVEPDLALSVGVRAQLLRTLADADLCEAALVGEPAAEVRAAAIATLAELGSLDADVRARALRDPDPWVRTAAIDLDAAVALWSESGDAERDASVRRVAARKLVAGRISGDLDRLCDADDPWIRARAVECIDASECSDVDLTKLLTATRDPAPMVRLAASARLDQVPGLDERLTALLVSSGAIDPNVAIAGWSRRIAALTPELAKLELDRALAAEASPALRKHLEALAVMFGGEVATASPSVEVVERARWSEPAPRVVDRRELGRTGISLAPMIVSGAFSLTPSSLAHAAEQGVDTYFWERRYTNMSRFLRQPRRQDLQVVTGSFHADRHGLLEDLERARRQLRRDQVDVFLLFWVRSPARLGAEALDTLREFQARGWIRSYGFSTHDRPIACAAIESGDWPVLMTRHSAAHRGAEQEVLPLAAAAGVGVLGFSALCYGRMLASSSVFERGAAATDCYRYSLAQPGVAACVSAPRRHRELDQNLAVLADTGLSPDQRDALIAHGTEVYADNKRFDRLLRRGGTAPLREAVLELFEQAEQVGVDADAPSV